MLLKRLPIVMVSEYCQPGPVGHRGVGILVRKALRCING